VEPIFLVSAMTISLIRHKLKCIYYD
jgi:hypothetical protein